MKDLSIMRKTAEVAKEFTERYKRFDQLLCDREGTFIRVLHELQEHDCDFLQQILK
jgi:hypothetical protein